MAFGFGAAGCQPGAAAEASPPPSSSPASSDPGQETPSKDAPEDPAPRPPKDPAAAADEPETEPGDHAADFEGAAEPPRNVVDLSDRWAPFAFTEDPAAGEAGTQPYRETLLALADERDTTTEDGEPIEGERYLELFGIFPTFRVLRGRLLDDDAHACHAAVDDRDGAVFEAVRGSLTAGGLARQRSHRREVRFIRAKLAHEVRVREVDDPDALRDVGSLDRLFRRLDALAPAVDALEAAQAHLVCAGLLRAGRFEAGILDPETRHALAAWQRRHFLISNGILDPASQETMAMDSRELDYRAVLRALRERVVDALGILEDGSARGGRHQVLGRVLDPTPMLPASDPGDDDPAVAELPGARDLVAPATEAAARELGWNSPEATAADFRAHPDFAERRVPLALPPVPDWYTDDLDLRAVIDRGDVWFEPPHDFQGRRRSQPVARRPSLRLVARHDGKDVALVRWSTTIGGWKREDAGAGGIRLKYKESPPGPAIWRDLVVSPAWLPPRATPDDELVRRDPKTGRWVPNHALFGPSYRSAYGLAMLVHHRRKDDAPPDAVADEHLVDEGIRTHGSVSYASIVGGTSHGCHRVFNHLAVRLAGFLLRHRPHVRHGTMSVRYQRAVRRAGRDVRFRMSTRGVRFELTPPVPVEVLPGRPRGSRDTPYLGFYPLAKTLSD